MAEETWLTDSIFVVEDFLTLEECQEFIDMGEDYGFEQALLNTAKGQISVAQVRNNDRVMFRNDDLANRLWEKAEDFVPVDHDGWRAIGVNEMFRIYRYEEGQQFDWHQDHPFERDSGEESRWTFLVYLNSEFDGGETSFDDSCSEDSFDPFKVTPRTGTALFFEHPNHHKGEPVFEGVKYVLRTDVMFTSLDDEFGAS